MSTQRMQEVLLEVARRYDADHDVPPGPMVPWSLAKVIEVLQELVDAVGLLQQAVPSGATPENSKFGDAIFVENRAPGENPPEENAFGQGILQRALDEMFDIQFTENNWQDARARKEEATQILRNMAAEFMEPSNARKAHLFEEYFEWMMGVPAVVMFSVLHTLFEEYGDAFRNTLAQDAEVDDETIDLIREGVNTYLENKE